MSAKFGLCAKRVYGLYVTFGIASGALFHILVSIFGFSEQLIAFIPQNYLKILGSIYFLYLGIKLCFSKDLISKEKDIQAHLVNMVSSIKAFRIGFLAMLFNPKSIIHFMIVFSSIMNACSVWIISLMGIELWTKSLSSRCHSHYLYQPDTHSFFYPLSVFFFTMNIKKPSIPPRNVFPQSFNLKDVTYWIKKNQNLKNR